MSRNEVLFSEFLRITGSLNSKLNIIPVLFGSLGLQEVSGTSLDPQDIDILVPLSWLQSEWSTLKNILEELGYVLFDLHEHEFHKGAIKAAFAFEEDLWEFAGIDYRNLEVTTYEGFRYRQLSLSDFLNVYTASVKDGYRRTKNNNKDLRKIELLTTLLAGQRDTTTQ
ncbi:MAG: nucleotidyltransferase family protein [Bacilli bacterium]